MRTVAEQIDAIAAPARRHQRMKPIDGGAPELEGIDVDEIRQHLAHARLVVKLFRLLVRQYLQLPAPQVARPHDRGSRPRRPAILRVHVGQRRRPLLPGVDHHPPFVEGEILVADPEPLAHGAVGAVAGQQVARLDRAGLPARQVRDLERDPVAEIRKVDEVVGEQHLDIVVSRDGAAQHRFEFRLDEMDARRPAQRVGRGNDVGLFDRLAVDPEILRAGMRADVGAELVADAGELHDAHDLVVGGDRARLVVDAGHALDDDDLKALASQQGRGGGPDRAISDDRDVAVHWETYRGVPTWQGRRGECKLVIEHRSLLARAAGARDLTCYQHCCKSVIGSQIQSHTVS